MGALKNNLVLGHSLALPHRSLCLSVSYTIDSNGTGSTVVLSLLDGTGSSLNWTALHIKPHTVIGVLQKSTVVPRAIDTGSTHERKSVSVASLRSRTELPYS